MPGAVNEVGERRDRRRERMYRMYWRDSKRSKDVQMTGGQTHMGKDLSDHHGFLDGGDDFQFTPTMRTAFYVDIEHSLE